MAKHQFQTEANQLLHLMIHSLYSNKEIFLRELISNASDALDKLQYLTLTDERLKNLQYEARIDVTLNKEEKTLTLSDTGIGMNDTDLIEHLGTIAKSGTKSFLEKLTGDAKKDSRLIGQFGVGFYSAFMVADKITVVSKKAGEEKAYEWISTGESDFDLNDAEKESHGTTITLHLKEDELEFADSWRVESIIKKYSDHIPFPIMVTKTETTGEGDGKKEEVKTEQVNKASALWKLGKSEIKEEEYKDFYKTISHDSDEPLTWLHNNVEGTLEYSTLFYIPKKAPFDLFRVDYSPGVKLYVKRVFITDDNKELMPTYLRFLRGIIDSEDLPLNVSREILQQNRIMANIRSQSVKKVLGELEKLAKNDTEKYDAFYTEFGTCLKEGLYSDYENRDKLLELLRFKSSRSDKMVSLAEYKANMGVDQKSIFYIMGEDETILRNSPLLESFKKKDIEVLIFDEEVDSVVMPSVPTYQDIPLHSVNSTEADQDLESEIDTGEEKKFEEILASMKSALGEEVKDVKLSKRLAESPACIVIDESDPNLSMQKMMKQMGGALGGMDIPDVKPILEINPEHSIFTKLLLKNDTETTSEVAHLLLDQAKLVEGMKIKDVIGYTRRMNKFIHGAI